MEVRFLNGNSLNVKAGTVKNLPPITASKQIAKGNCEKVGEEQVKESKTKQHFYTSLAKSVVRIGAGIALCYGDLVLTGALLIAAEVLGVIEEL